LCRLADEIEKALAANPVALFLVRDNDGAYGAGFRDRLRAMNICDRPTQPHSPWQNGHVERLIGSIRRECLDHHIILSAGHLRRVLGGYPILQRKPNSSRPREGFARAPRYRSAWTHRFTSGSRRIAPPIRTEAAEMRFSQGTPVLTIS